jgi:hypothetical protein
MERRLIFNHCHLAKRQEWNLLTTSCNKQKTMAKVGSHYKNDFVLDSENTSIEEAGTMNIPL